MTGRYDVFCGARVRCGACGKTQEFGAFGGGGGDTLARKSGWLINHGPQPYVRCPKCAPSSEEPPIGSRAAKREDGLVRDTVKPSLADGSVDASTPSPAGGVKTRPLTVEEAEQATAALTGDAAKAAKLIAACLNAQAALTMLGCKIPKRKGHFLPVGVLTLVEIDALLATMPAEVALVRAAMAFACDYCGRPAETGTEDGWICEACYLAANGWRDIESAPKDGTPILACSTNHDAAEVVCWQDGAPSGSQFDGAADEPEEGWVNNGPLKDRFYANPRWFTHWKPLDAPPESPSQGGEG